MKKLELRRSFRARIEAGAKAQQVFDELRGPGNAVNEELADLVRFVPTLERRAEHRAGQWLLMGLIALAIAWKCNLVMSAVPEKGWPPVIFQAAFGIGYGIALFGVAKYWRRAHSVVGFLAFLDLMHLHDLGGGTEGTGLAVILLFGALAVSGFCLQRKLTPDYIKLKEPYRNAEGMDRIRELVRFGD